MSRLDDWGLREFWYRIGDIFARKTEAGGSLSWGGTTLGLVSVAGGSLDSVDLNNGLASDAEAAHSLSNNGATLTLSSVNNTALSTVNLTNAIESIATAKASEAVGDLGTIPKGIGAEMDGDYLYVKLLDGDGAQIAQARVKIK